MKSITQEEKECLDLHAEHRWADVTTYGSKRREIYCLDCSIIFEAGPLDLAASEPLESAALRAQRKVVL